MQNILFVGIGGFIGACLRYWVSIGSARLFGAQFPYGTLLVNIIGGILIGLLMELSLTTDIITPGMRLFLMMGGLGGFTTFSAFSYETVNLISDGSYLLGTANICLNVILSLVGVVIGKSVSHII